MKPSNLGHKQPTPNLAGVCWHTGITTKARFPNSATTGLRGLRPHWAREKRGGPDQRRLSLDIGEVADLAREEKTEQIIALDEALRRLESQRPRVARVVHLRFYAGLSVDETARTLGISARTVNLDWAFARAWLYKELADAANTPGEMK